MKNYEQWHKKKKLIDNKELRVFFHEREVWFSHIGDNIGFEEDGRGTEFLRPIIIVKKFSNEIFWAIPLTRTIKHGLYYFIFSFDHKTNSAALVSQLKILDAKRLKYKMGTMNEKDFIALKEKIKQLLV